MLLGEEWIQHVPVETPPVFALENWKNQIRSLPRYPTSFPLISSNVSNHHKLVVYHISPYPFGKKPSPPTKVGPIRKISPTTNKIQVKEQFHKRQEILPKAYWSIYKFTTSKLSPPIDYYHFFDHCEVPANHHVVDPVLLPTRQCHPEGVKKIQPPTVTERGRFLKAFPTLQQRKLHPWLETPPNLLRQQSPI